MLAKACRRCNTDDWPTITLEIRIIAPREISIPGKIYSSSRIFEVEWEREEVGSGCARARALNLAQLCACAGKRRRGREQVEYVNDLPMSGKEQEDDTVAAKWISRSVRTAERYSVRARRRQSLGATRTLHMNN